MASARSGLWGSLAGLSASFLGDGLSSFFDLLDLSLGVTSCTYSFSFLLSFLSLFLLGEADLELFLSDLVLFTDLSRSLFLSFLSSLLLFFSLFLSDFLSLLFEDFALLMSDLGID